MKKSSNFKAVMRAMTVSFAAIALIGGVTFALLQSQQIKLTGNTIQTASVNLLLSSDGTNYSSSLAGYNFNNIVPGGPAVPTSGYPLFLRNSGGAPLNIKFAVTSAPSNPEGVDLNKVNIVLTRAGSGTSQTFTLQQLIAAGASGGLNVNDPVQLFAGNTAQYTIQASMAADAMSGSSAALGNIDFAFTGLAQ